MVIFTNLTVDGNDFNEYLSATLLRNTSENSASSRLTIECNNQDGKLKEIFSIGTEVVLYADKDVDPAITKVFTGIVTETAFSGKGGNSERLTVTCRDYTKLLQSASIEPEVYTNQEISAIVTDIMNKYSPDSEITTNNVQVTGKTLPRESFSHDKVFDALKRLAEYVDFVFYIDENKDLHFEQKGSVSSGITLDNSNSYKASFDRDREKIINQIYVYGDRFLTAAPTESFTSDGIGSVFTLNEKPHNTRVVSAGINLKGGIYQQNTTPVSGVEYLVNFHDAQIILVSGTDLGYSSIPASGGSIVIDYDASRPIIKFARNSASISQYKLKEAQIIDSNIQDPEQAADIAKNQVELYSEPALEGNVDVLGIVDIVPSQTVVANFPNHQIEDLELSVIQCTYTFTEANKQKEKVLKVKIGERVNKINDVFKDLLLKQRRLEAGQIDTSGILSRLELDIGSVGFRIIDWKIRTQVINDSFVLGHPINGILGSVGVGSLQPLLGDQRSPAVIERSGVN